MKLTEAIRLSRVIPAHAGIQLYRNGARSRQGSWTPAFAGVT
jgi:hypothetical protein